MKKQKKDEKEKKRRKQTETGRNRNERRECQSIRLVCSFDYVIGSGLIEIEYAIAKTLRVSKQELILVTLNYLY